MQRSRTSSSHPSGRAPQHAPRCRSSTRRSSRLATGCAGRRWYVRSPARDQLTPAARTPLDITAEMMQASGFRRAVLATPTLAAPARKDFAVNLHLRQRAAVGCGHFQVAVDACRYAADDEPGVRHQTGRRHLMSYRGATRRVSSSDEETWVSRCLAESPRHLEAGIIPRVPSPVVAQVSRSGRQANLAADCRHVNHVETHDPEGTADGPGHNSLIQALARASASRRRTP